jgi:trimeric autotransporter adhesin
MKKLLTIVVLSFFTSIIFGQAPLSFNYQAVLRDAIGVIKTNTSANVRIDLLQGSPTGTSVYSESFTATTNTYGLINIQIGKGTVISGSISTINWGGASYFIKVSVDGSAMGTSQLLSVPYALYAGTSASSFSGNYNDLTQKPVIYNVDYKNLGICPNSMASNATGMHNIAIGTNSLTVNTTGQYNTTVGSFTLSKNSTGEGNIAVGHAALSENTIGTYNVAMGGHALRFNNSGYNNTAIGYTALYSNTNGSGNTANGYRSLYYNTGSWNTASGYESLRNNTTGEFNNAYGIQSLYSNTSGSSNVAIGTYALYSNETSNKNTAIGFEALKANTYWDNTAIGYQALSANTEGFDNVAMGVNALDKNTTGNGNTAIGKNTMSSHITGDNNTSLGFNANVSSGISNATAIGYQATVTASNKIVLGNASAITVGGYGAWANWSDRRLKENIVYSNKLGLRFVLELKPVSYNYIKDSNKRRRDGLIAQDVQQTLKDLGLNFSGLIIDDDADKTLNLSYAEFVIPLINAVRELNTKNELLQQEIQVFEQSLLEMKAEIAKLKQTIQSK